MTLVPHSAIHTPRLVLVPITLDIVEAVFTGDRAHVEKVAEASVPAAWPGRALIERAFSASLDRIRQAPEERLWGDRLMIMRDGPRRIIGSVIFHGRPGEDGVAEVGYGVEAESQGLGIATEGTRAAVDWALAEPGVRMVRATTPPWHRASIRVLEKSGFTCAGTEEHEALGEISVFERWT
jgi:RimJ/RimL family protein N-acetyltransferase